MEGFKKEYEFSLRLERKRWYEQHLILKWHFFPLDFSKADIYSLRLLSVCMGV